MTVEEYRQRMIQAFHNADCDELIAICALPTEKEFEHLEWLLKNHFKKEPCEDAVNRQAVLEAIFNIGMCTCSTKEVEVASKCLRAVEALPPVTSQLKMVTNTKEAEMYPINEDISKGFKEFTKIMFKQGQAES